MTMGRKPTAALVALGLLAGTASADQITVGAPNPVTADGGIGGAGYLCWIQFQSGGVPAGTDRAALVADFEDARARWWRGDTSAAEDAAYQQLAPLFNAAETDQLLGADDLRLYNACRKLWAVSGG